MQILYFKKWFPVPNARITYYYNNSIFMKSKLLISAFNILVTIPVLLMSTEKKVMSKSVWFSKLMLITVLTLIASFKKKNLQDLSWVSFLKNHLIHCHQVPLEQFQLLFHLHWEHRTTQVRQLAMTWYLCLPLLTPSGKNSLPLEVCTPPVLLSWDTFLNPCKQISAYLVFHF